jgi:hypothetical protein
MRPNSNRYFIFVLILVTAGCGQNNTASDSTSPCTNTINVGQCLMSAGYDVGTEKWRAFAALEQNGNTNISSRIESGKCIVTVRFSGSFEGNSYNKTVKCPVTW